MTDLNLLNKFQEINQQVKIKLKKKGFVLPTRNQDGSISVGKYSIHKKKKLFYIKDKNGDIVVKNINLPQSAITIANNLALTNYIDKLRVEMDYKYGYATSDNLVHRQKALNYIRKNQYDQAEIMLAKSSVAHYRAETYKNAIVRDFEKLIRIDK